MQKRKKEIVLGVVLFFGYLFLSSHFNFSIPCLFYEMTGLFCPGCGITRMFKALLNLEFYQAFRYNPLVFCYFFGYLLYLSLFYFLKKMKNYTLKINPKLTTLLLIITIAFGILRNIPIFSFLQPVLRK